MPTQSAARVLAAIKRESTVGTAAASGSGATQLRLLDSPGLELNRGTIRSGERRFDQLEHMGRLGGGDVGGSYNTEVTVGGAVDLFLESITRGRWSAAISNSITITTTTSTIVRASGSFITDGYREGDVLTLTGDVTTANNSLRMQVYTVSALTITLYGTPLTLNATPRAVTVVRLKKVITPAGNSAVLYNDSYSVEQHDLDIDESELFLGTRLTQLALSMRPRQMSTAAWTMMGLSRQAVGTASAPYFTTPGLTTGDPVIIDDGYVFYKGSLVTVLTGMDLNLAIAAATQPVAGSFFSGDVYMNTLSITGNVSMLRQDLATVLADFDAETEFAIGCILREPQGTPRPAVGVYLPRVKIGKVSAAFLGGDAAKVETRELIVGAHAGDTDTDAGAVQFSSSAA
jgi:hypothetical protein